MKNCKLNKFIHHFSTIRFPIAICNLADLEEIECSDSKLHIEKLYEKSIRINNEIYEGYHVYPYTYFGGYHYRKNSFVQALMLWKQGAEAVSK